MLLMSDRLAVNIKLYCFVLCIGVYVVFMPFVNLMYLMSCVRNFTTLPTIGVIFYVTTDDCLRANCVHETGRNRHNQRDVLGRRIHTSKMART